MGHAKNVLNAFFNAGTWRHFMQHKSIRSSLHKLRRSSVDLETFVDAPWPSFTLNMHWSVSKHFAFPLQPLSLICEELIPPDQVSVMDVFTGMSPVSWESGGACPPPLPPRCCARCGITVVLTA